MSTALHPPLRQQTPAVFTRVLAALAGGVAMFFAIVFTLMTGFLILFTGRVYPGVRVAGINLSGMSRAEAALAITEGLPYPDTGLIVFEDLGQTWVLHPSQLGLYLNSEASAQAAFKVGRQGWPWERWAARTRGWQTGVDVSPTLIFDERAAQLHFNQIAAQINQPMKEAGLAIDGLDVVVEQGQVGRLVDVDANLAQLKGQLYKLQDGSLPLIIQEFPPEILDVNAQAEIATRILSQPLTLRVPGASQDDPGPWTFDTETLSSMLTIQRVSIDGSIQYQVGLDPNTLYNFLYPISPALVDNPQNARFIFNDDTRQLEVIQPAVIGRELMIDESIAKINAEIRNGAHEVDLVFDYANPEVTDDATGAELGITELVSAETSYFYGSDSARIQNIKTAASRFHGLLIPPGATFSMVENIGDISLDSGFAEALIIFGNRTIKGVGGGVCQVSTTLFRTVFFGGFPVVERYPHAYRVIYYELTYTGAANHALAGLDATVYAPVVDFKFTNDTPYWLLMETYVSEGSRSLTWKFYSTSDDRTVDWSTTGLQDKVKPPKPIYEENDKLRRGVIKQVDWAVQGATVTVTRTVYRDGEVLHHDIFKTKYRPWQTICEYGPGTKNYPPPENKQDLYSCKKK